MNVSDFKYDLPEELIAQVPIQKRDESIQRYNRLPRRR